MGVFGEMAIRDLRFVSLAFGVPKASRSSVEASAVSKGSSTASIVGRNVSNDPWARDVFARATAGSFRLCRRRDAVPANAGVGSAFLCVFP